MANTFYERPILNSPYEKPRFHHPLDEHGQPLGLPPVALRQGFVYERVPHITLKSIANNSRIDDIWEKCQATLEPRARRTCRGLLSFPGRARSV